MKFYQWAIPFIEGIELHGGGVLLAVKNDISSKILDTLSDIEGITVEINHINPIIISVLYATPQSSISYVNNCCKPLSNLSDTCLPIIVVGDFSLPDINWETLSGKHYQEVPLFPTNFVSKFLI